jgi:hypothetical protein
MTLSSGMSTSPKLTVWMIIVPQYTSQIHTNLQNEQRFPATLRTIR